MSARVRGAQLALVLALAASAAMAVEQESRFGRDPWAGGRRSRGYPTRGLRFKQKRKALNRRRDKLARATRQRMRARA